MPKLLDYLHHIIDNKKTSAAALSTILCISKDAMYKKLSGKSPMLFTEVIALQQALGFNLEDVIDTPIDSKITFSIKEFNKLDTPENTLRSYVTQLAQDLTNIATIGTPHVYYAAKDLPLFCFFSSPILTSFKLYFWYLTLFDSDSRMFTYSSNWLPQDVIDTAMQLHQMYLHINSTEIWNQETINSTLHQIEYCTSIGVINNTDASKILQALLQFVDNLEQYAATETKKGDSIFKLYFNEVLILDNTVLFEVGPHKVFYLPLQTLNFLSNTSAAFTTKMYNWIHKQIKKSMLISGEGEKERVRFIGNYKKGIEAMMKKVNNE